MSRRSTKIDLSLELELKRRTASTENRVDDVSGDVGQRKVAASIAIGEPLVVDSKQVLHRRVQFVDFDDVLSSSVDPYVVPPLIPPPANHIVKPFM